MKSLRLIFVLTAGALIGITHWGARGPWESVAVLVGVGFAAVGSLAVLHPGPVARRTSTALGVGSLFLPAPAAPELQIPAALASIAVLAGIASIWPVREAHAPRLGEGRTSAWHQGWIRLLSWIGGLILIVLGWTYLAPDRLSRLVERDLVAPVLAGLLLLGFAVATRLLTSASREDA